MAASQLHHADDDSVTVTSNRSKLLPFPTRASQRFDLLQNGFSEWNVSDVMNGREYENQSSGPNQLRHEHPDVVGSAVHLLLGHGVHLADGQGKCGEKTQTENRG